MSEAFRLSNGEILLLDFPVGDGWPSACALVRPLPPDGRKALKALPDRGLEGGWLQWPSTMALLIRPKKPDAWADLRLWGPEDEGGYLAAQIMEPVWRLRFGPRLAFALLPPGGRVEIRSFREMMSIQKLVSLKQFVAVQVASDGDKSVVTVDVGERTGAFRPVESAVRLLEARLSATGAEGSLDTAPAPEEAGWTPDFLVVIRADKVFRDDDELLLAVVGKGKDGRVGAEQALERILER